MVVGSRSASPSFSRYCMQLDVLFNHGHTGTGLDQRPVLLFGFDQLWRKTLRLGLLLLLIYRSLRPDRRPGLSATGCRTSCRIAMNSPSGILSVLNFHHVDLLFHDLERDLRLALRKQAHRRQNITFVQNDIRLFRTERRRRSRVAAAQSARSAAPAANG